MTIEFATCDRATALKYIQKALPSKNVTEDQVMLLLNLVEMDILRVRDPQMYDNKFIVIPGKEWKIEHQPEIKAAVQQLKDNKI